MKHYALTTRRKMHLLLVAVLFSSCSHYYYAPNTANIPMLREKGDVRLNFNFYGTDEAEGGELQAAVATGKRTGLMFNLLSASSHGGLFQSEAYMSTTPPSGSGTYVELGYGFFAPIPKSKWVFETYAGVGTGKVSNWYSENEKSKLGFTKIFVQPSLGWRTKYFELGISNRFAFASMRVKESTNHVNQDVQYIKDHKSAILLEPSFLIRFGLKHVKISANYTHSGNMSHNWQQETTGISVGLSIPFNMLEQ